MEKKNKTKHFNIYSFYLLFSQHIINGIKIWIEKFCRLVMRGAYCFMPYHQDRWDNTELTCQLLDMAHLILRSNDILYLYSQDILWGFFWPSVNEINNIKVCVRLKSWMSLEFGLIGKNKNKSKLFTPWQKCYWFELKNLNDFRQRACTVNHYRLVSDLYSLPWLFYATSCSYLWPNIIIGCLVPLDCDCPRPIPVRLYA